MSGGVLFQDLEIGAFLEMKSACPFYADRGYAYELFAAEGADGL